MIWNLLQIMALVVIYFNLHQSEIIYKNGVECLHFHLRWSYYQGGMCLLWSREWHLLTFETSFIQVIVTLHNSTICVVSYLGSSWVRYWPGCIWNTKNTQSHLEILELRLITKLIFSSFEIFCLAKPCRHKFTMVLSLYSHLESS